MTTMAECLLREQLVLDANNAEAAYHGNSDITDDTKAMYNDQHVRGITVLYRKYSVERREVRTLSNGIKEYELVCPDGSVVGTIHDV